MASSAITTITPSTHSFLAECPFKAAISIAITISKIKARPVILVRAIRPATPPKKRANLVEGPSLMRRIQPHIPAAMSKIFRGSLAISALIKTNSGCNVTKAGGNKASDFCPLKTSRPMR